MPKKPTKGLSPENTILDEKKDNKTIKAETAAAEKAKKAAAAKAEKEKKSDGKSY